MSNDVKYVADNLDVGYGLASITAFSLSGLSTLSPVTAPLAPSLFKVGTIFGTLSLTAKIAGTASSTFQSVTTGDNWEETGYRSFNLLTSTIICQGTTYATKELLKTTTASSDATNTFNKSMVKLLGKEASIILSAGTKTK